MRRAGGRPKHESWEKLKFKLIKKDNGKYTALCTICSQHLQNTAEERLKTHRKKCLLMEEDVSLFSIDSVNDPEMNNNMDNQDNAMDSSCSKDKDGNSISFMSTATGSDVNADEFLQSNNSVSNLNSSGSKKQMQQTRIKSFLDNVKEKDISAINDLLAEFFFGCNIDAELVESKYFIKFIKFLRPAYTPPRAEEMYSVFLDKAFKNLQKREANLQKRPGVLLLSMENDAVGTKDMKLFMKDLDGKIIFLSSTKMIITENYADDIYKLMTAAIDESKNVFSLEVYAIVSKESILQNFNDGIFSLLCNIEIANRVGNALTNNELYSKVQIIFHECLSSEFLYQVINSDFVETSAGPEDEKNEWETHYELYFFFVSNVQMLKKMAADNSYEFHQDVTLLLFDRLFESNVNNLFNAYKSLDILIKKMNEKDFSIADSVENWLLLKSNSTSDLLNSCIENHVMTVLHPATLTANFLHPEYRGRRLSTNQSVNVNQFLLDNLDEKGLDEYIKYKEGKGLFIKLFKSNIKTPLIFWNVAEQEYANLSSLAKKLLTIPASALDVKCNFRCPSKLSSEKQQKLKHLYYNLRFLDSKQ